MSTLFLHAFLYVDVFAIGVIATIAFGHGLEHFTTENGDDSKPHLSAEVKARMLHNSEEQYKKVLEHSVGILQHDLEHSAEQINGLVTRFAGVIVGDEMEKYRAELAKLHTQATADMGNIKQEISGHQAELESKAAAEIDLEKQKLIKQIDTKLGDAVASFLVEALQHNVDLGNQGEYLVSLLEQHKNDLKQEVSGGA
jgi:uncharacterized protein YjbJ (UPF0337 family)